MIFRLVTSAIILFAVLKMSFGAHIPGWTHLGVLTRTGSKLVFILLGH